MAFGYDPLQCVMDIGKEIQNLQDLKFFCEKQEVIAIEEGYQFYNRHRRDGGSGGTTMMLIKKPGEDGFLEEVDEKIKRYDEMIAYHSSVAAERRLKAELKAP